MIEFLVWKGARLFSIPSIADAMGGGGRDYWLRTIGETYKLVDPDGEDADFCTADQLRQYLVAMVRATPSWRDRNTTAAHLLAWFNSLPDNPLCRHECKCERLNCIPAEFTKPYSSMRRGHYSWTDDQGRAVGDCGKPHDCGCHWDCNQLGATLCQQCHYVHREEETTEP